MLKSGAIADFTGISDRTIRDWQTKGIIHQSARMDAIVQEIVQHYKAQLEEARKPKDVDPLYFEKTRLTQAQADKIKLDIAEKEGELVNARGIVMAWSNYIQACKKRLLAIPTKLAPRLVNITEVEEAKELLESVIDEALIELGSEEFVRASATVDPDSDCFSSTTEIDG
jgi:phage terminase Nu1 subunit (DNA packaging protein)